MKNNIDKGLLAYEVGDYKTAFERLKPFAENGNTYAQLRLGFMYGSGEGVDLDEEQEEKWLRLSAEQGFAEAQHHLSNLYFLKDEKESIRWCRLAAKQGNKYAQFNLAGMYERGEGTKQNYAKALEQYKKCCNLGNKHACNNYDLLNKRIRRMHIII